MPMRRRNAPSVKSDTGATRLLPILVAALTCQSLGCASANVAQKPPGPDSGVADTAPGSKDSAGNKNDGPAGDVVYGTCDPFTNSGCSGGKKCTALQQSNNTLALGCGDKGTKTEGVTCSQTVTSGTQTGDDCADGLACFNIGGTTCHKICATSGTDTCPATETCSLGNVGGLTGLTFCQPIVTCQPLEQTGCPANQACYFGTKGAVCAPPGSKQPGEACTNANECVPGSNCLVVGTGICTSFCSTADGGTPACSGASTGGTLCIALSSGTGTDEPNLGSCRVKP
jgi:hypothetical protein